MVSKMPHFVLYMMVLFWVMKGKKDVIYEMRRGRHVKFIKSMVTNQMITDSSSIKKSTSGCLSSKQSNVSCKLPYHASSTMYSYPYSKRLFLEPSFNTLLKVYILMDSFKSSLFCSSHYKTRMVGWREGSNIKSLPFIQ